MLAARELGDECRSAVSSSPSLDQGPLALRAAVTLVIGPDDHGALGDEPLGDVLVAADVLAVAVGEQDEELASGFGQVRTWIRPLARRSPSVSSSALRPPRRRRRGPRRRRSGRRPGGRSRSTPGRSPPRTRGSRSSGSVAPSIAERRSESIVSCGKPASASAISIARSRWPPSATISVSSPQSSASSASMIRPVRIRSSARPSPTIRGSRSVPPSISGTPQRRSG